VTSFFIVTLFITLFFPSASQTFADSSNSAIRSVTDLAQDANLARSQGLVILIEFSNDDCEYCRLLENEFLEPMSINQEYREKVMIRSLALNGDRLITGFQGESISASQFASKYQVMVTPTMVFLDTNGNELSEKLVGIWSLDYFGSYIDERIDAAREKVL
jgi:thioredoxin-related protein